MIYPVFTVQPDFHREPEYGAVTDVQRAGLSPARDTAFFPEDEPVSTFSFTFAALTLAEARAIKAFFLARAGRTEPFYLPSWRPELPSPAGTIGENVLTITAEDYDLGDHADYHTRQIWIMEPGEALFYSEVVAAADAGGGEWELNLASFLPFTLTDKAIAGFLHLARFEEDEIAYDHASAAIMEAEIQFRSVRQWSGEPASFTVEQIDLALEDATLMGFVSGVVEDAEVTPYDSRLAHAEGWDAWVNGDGIRRILSGTPYATAVPSATGALSALTPAFVDTQHLSMTFDPDGLHMLAWQHSATEFRIARDPSDPVFANHAGLDPLISSNVEVDATVSSGTQTNFVYYRKAGDPRLYVRRGTGFNTESVAAVLPSLPLKLKRVYADGSFLKLEYLDSHFRRVTLTSAAYPS